MALPSLTRSVEIPKYPLIVRMDRERTIAVLEKLKSAELQNIEVSFPDLLMSLHNCGLVNIDTDGLEENLPAILAGEPYLFARGSAPTHGKDGYIKFSFENQAAKKHSEHSETERVDFHTRNDINNVFNGDFLAEEIPMEHGINGRDVFDNPIIARTARNIHIIAGKNVRLSADGKKAYSEIDGFVKEVRGRISVDPVVTITGDVNFKSGSIKFNGDVKVTGNVNETFEIDAGGSIHVDGLIDRANLRSDADILIGLGIYGKDDVLVEAVGDISFDFAENANIRAGGDIYARAGMIDCIVTAGRKLHFQAVGKTLVGGHIIARHGIVANSLGTPPALPQKPSWNSASVPIFCSPSAPFAKAFFWPTKNARRKSARRFMN